MTLKKLISRGPVLLLALLALALPSAATADPVLIIEFTGLNLEYSGGQLCDAADCAGNFGVIAEADKLTTMTFGVDLNDDGSVDTEVGILTTNIYADVRLGVTDLPEAGGTVTGTGGIFDIFTNPNPTDAFGLGLDVGDWSATYVPGFGLKFFGGGVATGIFDQDLPFGLEATMPVEWSFSTQIALSTLVTSGGFVEEFSSSGTGEIKTGFVPEPGTLLLLGGGLAGLALFRRRRP